MLFLQVGTRGEPSLQRLDRERPERSFRPTGHRNSQPGEPPSVLGNSGSTTASVQTLWAALEDTPIILVTMPFVRVFSRSTSGPVPEPPELPRTSFILVSLDLQEIHTRVLPQLVSRYFSTEDIFDYRVAVAPRGDASRLIFTSDPAPASNRKDPASATGRHASPADAVVPLFAVRLAEFSALFVPSRGAVGGGELAASRLAHPPEARAVTPRESTREFGRSPAQAPGAGRSAARTAGRGPARAGPSSAATGATHAPGLPGARACRRRATALP